MIKSSFNKLTANNSINESTHSSSHTPSVAGDHVETVQDVKVEITPPAPNDPAMSIQNSFSVESAASLTLNLNTTEISKSQSTSPQPRKFSEMLPQQEGFLNPVGSFTRLSPSPPTTASARLFKRIEQMIDLSLPYNHYRCLSPSDSNLSQCMESKTNGTSTKMIEAGKPGSSRLLRRQFSLDRDDHNSQKAGNLETISSLVDSTKFSSNVGLSATTRFQYAQHAASTSLNNTSLTTNLNKQHSASVNQDLEKIEEIPVSPMSSSIHNSSVNLSYLTNEKNDMNCNNNSATTKFSNDVNLNMESINLS